MGPHGSALRQGIFSFPATQWTRVDSCHAGLFFAQAQLADFSQSGPLRLTPAINLENR